MSGNYFLNMQQNKNTAGKNITTVSEAVDHKQ